MICFESRDKRIAMSPKPKKNVGGISDQTDKAVLGFNGRNLLPIAVLLLVSLALYYHSLSNGFVFDDFAVIVENKHIKDLGNSLPAFLDDSYFRVAGGESSYRPIPTLSYFLIHSLAGLNPFYYHLCSVLLHTLNVLLVYRLFCLLLDDRFKALLGGLLFACHPVLTEAVNCISFNEDLFAASFFLLAMILYVRRTEYTAGNAAYCLSLFFFFLGLLSKEMAITLPAVILLYDLTFRAFDERTPFIKCALNTVKKGWPLYLGYAAVGGFYLVLRFILITKPGDAVKPNFGALFDRLLYLPNHIFSFVKLAVAPYNLNVEHVFSYPPAFFEFNQLCGFGFTTGLAVFSVILFRRFKEIAFGIWWFGITLGPVYNLIQIFNPIAERYLYIPVIGFCLAAPVVLYGLFSRTFSRPAAVKMAALIVVAVIAGVFANITLARHRDWKDGLTLWSKTVRQSPKSGVAHGSLGRAYQEQGLLDEAAAQYRMAVKLMPNHFKAYYNLATVYEQKGNFSQAVENLKKALSINPGYANAHYNLALLYHKQDMMAEAIQHYHKVIELVPEDVEARNNLGVAFAIQGDLDQAIQEWQKVLAIDPLNKGAQDNLRKAEKMMD